MSRIDQIVVRVQMLQHPTEQETSKMLASKSVSIMIEPEQKIRVQDLIDACQRAVAQCVEQVESAIPASQRQLVARKSS